jgi:hypothetical protein
MRCVSTYIFKGCVLLVGAALFDASVLNADCYEDLAGYQVRSPAHANTGIRPLRRTPGVPSVFDDETIS